MMLHCDDIAGSFVKDYGPRSHNLGQFHFFYQGLSSPPLQAPAKGPFARQQFNLHSTPHIRPGNTAKYYGQKDIVLKDAPHSSGKELTVKQYDPAATTRVQHVARQEFFTDTAVDGATFCYYLQPPAPLALAPPMPALPAPLPLPTPPPAPAPAPAPAPPPAPPLMQPAPLLLPLPVIPSQLPAASLQPHHDVEGADFDYKADLHGMAGGHDGADSDDGTDSDGEADSDHEFEEMWGSCMSFVE
ncbi:hypothetical protein EDB19DRAFT_1835234 [Suillus lakei]|nr:hypothetical protein EDB19DRAFT_1835234 [Suillus lakei]